MHRLLCAAVAATSLLGLAPAHAVEAVQVWHQGREIAVVDQDGWAVYDGDILIGRMEEVLRRSAIAAPDGHSIGGLGIAAKSVTLGSGTGRWPRNAAGVFEMPYEVESDPDGNVPAAVAAFNQQLSGFMQAVPHTTQPDYVAFTLSATDNGGACSSSVGRIGGRQVIQGSHVCAGGTLVHEMGHAVGLWHEQEHQDRASYITLDLSVIEPARVFNFSQQAGQRSGTPYDYASIMHYSAGTFSKTGAPSMETIPPGIGIGQRLAYSAGDLEAIHRQYGAPPQQVTVTSLPTGLTVLVDGASVTTPSTFSWAIGSTHVIDVPAGVQVVNGVASVFGRWNVDRTGDLQPRRTITVAAGNGAVTAPSTAPAISTYTAAFVRYKEVRLSTSGKAGTVNPSPAPSPLPGVAGTYYRDRQPFTLQAVAGAGATFGGWGGGSAGNGYVYSGAFTTQYRNPFSGPLVISDTHPTFYEYSATFFDTPFITVRARAQDGEALAISATVTRSGSTAKSELLPYNSLAWTLGQTGTLAMSTSALTPLSSAIRYRFLDWDGDTSPTITVTNPAAGEASKVVTANFTKEYQAFKQVIPSCAATMTLPSDPSGWYAHGSSLPVTLSPASGWVFLGWEGSLSGTSLTPSLAVADTPSLTARFNTIATPLTVTSVTPDVILPNGTITGTINGTGFTPASEVYLNGVRIASTYVSSTQLTATADASGAPAGMVLVTVTNRVGAGSCSVSASGAIDVLGLLASDVTPQTGWWWNANESGRGFFIEKRGNNLFMAGYLYEADGRATWFSASGAMSGSSFSADMTTFRSGQTLTGAYTPPSNGPILGHLSLTFTAPDQATLTWPGGTTTLTRFGFGSGGAGPGENGWWWNAGESGRGFSIETQGNAIFMAGFMYDASGNPVWYAAQGTLASGTMTTTLQQYANGQTLTGAYKAPTVLNNNVGAMTLTFLGSRSANLTLPGGRVLGLSRFDF